MKIVAIPRAEQGSGASRRLRSAGFTRGIIYGGSVAPLPIKIDHNVLFHSLRREIFHSSILDMEIDGKVEQVLLRDYQMHAFKPLVLHVDFQRVSATQPIHMKVPLHFLNEESSPAVSDTKATVFHVVTELDITCLPGDLPAFIEVDLASLTAGQTIHLSDLVLPKGVSPVSTDENMAIVNASGLKNEEAPEESEE
jgi:large subunit ribosomal protein L25